LIPDTLEGWAYLLVACFIGFAIGQWMRARRKKADSTDKVASYYKRELEYADRLAKKGKSKKRNKKR